jgi:hypothetical protein
MREFRHRLQDILDAAGKLPVPPQQHFPKHAVTGHAPSPQQRQNIGVQRAALASV